MLYWPQVHWLQLMAVMVGSINQMSRCCSSASFSFLIYSFGFSEEFYMKQRNCFVSSWARRRIFAGSIVALQRMLRVFFAELNCNESKSSSMAYQDNVSARSTFHRKLISTLNLFFQQKLWSFSSKRLFCDVAKDEMRTWNVSRKFNRRKTFAKSNILIAKIFNWQTFRLLILIVLIVCFAKLSLGFLISFSKGFHIELIRRTLFPTIKR